MGHKRTMRLECAMSAVPRKPDIASAFYEYTAQLACDVVKAVSVAAADTVHNAAPTFSQRLPR